jgi:gag-polypeptide of LTR copia-type
MKTAAEIWLQLCTIKEPKSTHAVLTAHKRLFHMTMEDSTRMEEHIAEFRHAQDQLANMGHALSDEDFSLLLITSLPETWDQFTSRLFGSIASVSLSLNVNSSELISILMEED